MTRLSEKLNTVFRCIVLILFGVFIAYLSLLSLFSTDYCFVGKTSVLVSDSPVKALVGYVVLTGAVILLKRCGAKRLAGYQERLRMLGNILLFLCLLFFAAATQLHPHGDQLAISNAAVGLRKYDFSLFTNNSYFVYWPFQSRIVVFLWGFFKLFGNLNYMAFQMMNAVCIVISVNLIAKIYAMTGFSGDKTKETLVFFACILFWPYLFYVTFIYGNIPGFACMMGAVYMLMRYMREHKARHLAGTVLLCAAGVWLKNTFLIFMVAILVFLLVDFWQRWRCRSLIGIVCVLAAVSLAGKASDAFVEHRLGFPLSEGSPMIAWITMAFGEDEDGKPVKFDGYNRDVYLENDLDTEKASEAALEELKHRLGMLTDTPAHMARFMGKKIAMAWNEPTFESLVANNRPETQIEQSGLVRRLLQEDNRNPMVKYANLFHALVLLGALTWVLCRGKKEAVSHLFFAVVFIGGFLFQLFWETYSQYTLFYFLLLIPYAVSGYLAAAEKAERCFWQKGADRKTAAGFGIALLVILMVGVLPFGIFKDLFKLNQDEISYTEELKAADAAKLQSEGAVEDGDYVLMPLGMDGYGIVSDGAEDENGALSVSLRSLDDAEEGIFGIYHEYGYDFLRLKSTQLLLSLTGNPADGDVQVGQDYEYAAWKIIEMPETGYAITYDGAYALAAEDGYLTLQPFTGGEEQLWQFVKR